MGNDFIIKFEFERQNEWKTFRKSLLFQLVPILGFIHYLLTKDPLGIYLGSGFLLITGPQIFLHIQYRLTDRDKTITINYSKQTVKIEKKGEIEKEFNFYDIDKIIRNKGQRDENNTAYALPTFFYNYTEIRLNNGERFYYTDFIAKNIGLKDVKKEERISFLNYID